MATATSTKDTPVERIPSIVKGVRATYDRGITRAVAWRKAQLRQIIKLIQDNRPLLASALKADLAVNDFWVEGVELEGSLNEAKEALEHLDSWMKPESVSTPLVNLPAASYVQREPFGVVLVIAPWNYPLSLLLNPLIAAIAAGNAVVIKPSEVSVETSRTLAELIPKYMDREAVAVVEGAVPQTTAVLKEKFDLILYTGNGAVGRIVMKAAAEHLTPVILELGGKSPAIVADDANVKKTARRLAWGKWTMNNGQTCVSPDYVITTPAMRPKLIAEFKTVLQEFYGSEPKDCKDISRMINERHTKRVADLLDDKENIDIVVGGQVNIAERYIAPTIITCGPEAKIMRDEIFGPVLPIITVDSLDDAITYVNKHDKPLALYVFSENSATAKRTITCTSSGGACINDVIMQVGNSALPFGGVGPSGMGFYHGKWGFDSFSHKKAVFVKYGPDPSLRYPPYNASKLAILARLRGLTLNGIKRPLMIAAFIAVAAVAMRYRAATA